MCAGVRGRAGRRRTRLGIEGLRDVPQGEQLEPIGVGHGGGLVDQEAVASGVVDAVLAVLLAHAAPARVRQPARPQQRARLEDLPRLLRRGVARGEVHGAVGAEGRQLRQLRLRREPCVLRGASGAVAGGPPRGHAAGHGASVLVRGGVAAGGEGVGGVDPREGRVVRAAHPEPHVAEHVAQGVGDDEARRELLEHEGPVPLAPVRAGRVRPVHPAALAGDGRAQEHRAHDEHEQARDGQRDVVPKRSRSSGNGSTDEADHEGGPASGAD